MLKCYNINKKIIVKKSLLDLNTFKPIFQNYK